MKATFIIFIVVLISGISNAQSMLCIYKGGYFIKNDNIWYEYRPAEWFACRD